MAEVRNLAVLSASQLGSKLNTSLSTGLTPGGGTPVNDGPTLTAFLSTSAPSAPATLVLDGPLTASGIFGGSGGDFTIEGKGWDTGFWMASGANDDCIRNGPPSPASVNPMFDPGANGLPSWICAFFGLTYTFSTFTVPARASNITLSNFCINGNRGNGTNGNSTSGDPRGLPMATAPVSAATNRFYCGIRIDNCDGLVLDRIKMSAISSFCIRLTNVSRVYSRGLNLVSWPPGWSPEYGPPPVYNGAGNGDGHHVNGNSHNIVVADSYFETSDDATAWNACEGYPGPITDGLVVNCTFHNCQTFARFYATNEIAGTAAQTGSVSGIRYQNCSGTANEVGFLFGLEAAYTRAANYDRLTDITISGNYGSPTLAAFFDNAGVVTFENVNWTGTNVYSSIFGMFAFSFNGATVNALNVTSCVLRRTAANNGALSLIDFSAAVFGGSTTGTHVINTLTISGFAVRDDTGLGLANLPYLIRMNANSTIKSLVINALDTTQIAALCASQYLSQILSVSGPGVLATGWQFPDSMMANNTPYISATGANAGKAVIKLAGTVTPL